MVDNSMAFGMQATSTGGTGDQCPYAKTDLLGRAVGKIKFAERTHPAGAISTHCRVWAHRCQRTWMTSG
jgi:hypothetical protein